MRRALSIVIHNNVLKFCIQTGTIDWENVVQISQFPSLDYSYHKCLCLYPQVQSIWKTAYKLTKLFAHPDYRGPMRAAASIKGKLEKFKINMPLITTLCNPGIKDRHWDMMSEKVSIM